VTLVSTIAKFNNVASTATITGDAICAEGREFIRFQIVMSGTGDPIGTIDFTCSLDDTTYMPRNITDSLLIDGLTTGVTWSSSAPARITINDPASVAVMVGFANPPPFIKITYTAGSGGHTSGFTIKMHLGRPG
jgi:hypothetical protein